MVHNDIFIESLTEDDGKILINIARNSIMGRKTGMDKIPEKFYTKAGAFVTINENKSLRGCIGYLRPVMPLKSAVEKAAWNAAFRDPRFEPVGSEELNRLTIEVTVIGVLKDVKYEDIRTEKPGKYGLYMENGIYSGTLLPQVALDNKMDMEEFIMETCLKAGMGRDCYKYSKIYAYEAKIFTEK